MTEGQRERVSTQLRIAKVELRICRQCRAPSRTGETENRGNGASRDFGLRISPACAAADRDCEFRIPPESAERRSEGVGEDVAEGLVALALADAVACAQALDANGNVIHSQTVLAVCSASKVRTRSRSWKHTLNRSKTPARPSRLNPTPNFSENPTLLTKRSAPSWSSRSCT